MARLDEETKLLIVDMLARFQTPTKVAAALKARGVEATPQQVDAYNPTTLAGRRLSDDLKARFEQERAAYLAGVHEVPLANLRVRLESLQEMHDHPDLERNLMLRKQLIEQIAREVGGVYTRGLPARDLTDDQLRRILGLPAGGPQAGGGAPGSESA